MKTEPLGPVGKTSNIICAEDDTLGLGLHAQASRLSAKGRG